jgi:hypothetical protein
LLTLGISEFRIRAALRRIARFYTKNSQTEVTVNDKGVFVRAWSLGATPHFQAKTCTRRDKLLVRGMRGILTKFMKDSVVRGCLLQLLYERRSEGSIPFGHTEQAVPPPGGISPRDWLRAVAQLSEYRLIGWTPLEDKSGMGLLSGFAKINDFGVKVHEAALRPRSGSLSIRADEPPFLDSNKRQSQRALRSSRRLRRHWRK